MDGRISASSPNRAQESVISSILMVRGAPALGMLHMQNPQAGDTGKSQLTPPNREDTDPRGGAVSK